MELPRYLIKNFDMKKSCNRFVLKHLFLMALAGKDYPNIRKGYYG